MKGEECTDPSHTQAKKKKDAKGTQLDERITKSGFEDDKKKQSQKKKKDKKDKKEKKGKEE